ncbi:BamA/TamA family outer membrane protein [Rhodobacteraceae bacterium 2CG4]|uniref:BamA/TamA family outer membrane protein n=1 Tax=Halovulum marinum TaxID=2662447 RepID=A0A6L5Z3R2_9RHOB|nr:autotransporter assembly complex family protein [Halovulum marinum]MSU90652.1 BamA/TamA family outer membrane protein [Halovulum marinum]
MIVATVPHSAAALELFGIKLWGEEEEDAGDLGILDPRDYTARFDVGPVRNGIADRLKQSSAVWTNRNDPASGAAGLITAAQEDYRAILAALYAEGYYSGAIGIRINGQEAANLSLGSRLSDPIEVQISVDPGPLYRFGKTDYVNPPPKRRELTITGSEARAREQFAPGEVAYADVVNQAGDEAVADWRAAGHPKAEVSGRDVLADHPRRRLDVTIRLDPGPRARFGRVAVRNEGKVKAGFIRYMTDIRPGDAYDPEDVERATDRLTNLGVFSVIRVIEGDEVGPDGTLPITVEAYPRAPRRIGVGAVVSSTEGLGLEGFWLHRNVFGRAERLRFDASVGGLFSEDRVDDLDYALGVTFTKPGFLSPNNDLVTGLETRQDVFDDYRARTLGGRVGLNRTFDEWLTGSVFVDFTYSNVEDDLGTRELYTLGLPVRLEWDRRNSDLDPTVGYYVAGEVKPMYEFEFRNTALRTEIEGRKYWSFAEGRTVLAARAGFGTILGGDLRELPPDELFFTGGGGSVRGYGFRANGIEVDGDTLGGRSAVEASVELRQRIRDRYGVVVFADAGLVSVDEIPSGDSDLKAGVGIGGRFYTGLGPLRLDVATPLDRDNGESAVTFYVGIGQAF